MCPPCSERSAPTAEQVPCQALDTRRARSGAALPAGEGKELQGELRDGEGLVAVQLVVERLQADPERLGGALLVATLLVERGEDDAPLRLGQRAADPQLEKPARRRRGLDERPDRGLCAR